MNIRYYFEAKFEDCKIDILYSWQQAYCGASGSCKSYCNLTVGEDWRNYTSVFNVSRSAYDSCVDGFDVALVGTSTALFSTFTKLVLCASTFRSRPSSTFSVHQTVLGGINFVSLTIAVIVFPLTSK